MKLTKPCIILFQNYITGINGISITSAQQYLRINFIDLLLKFQVQVIWNQIIFKLVKVYKHYVSSKL